MNKILSTLIILSIFVMGLIFSGIQKVNAGKDHDDHKVTICHCSRNHCQTQEVDKEGAKNHLEHHEDDYKGSCSQPTQSPTPTVTETPDPTETPEPTATPEASITPTQTPTEEPKEEHKNEEPKPDGSVSQPTCDTLPPPKIAWYSYNTGILGDGKIQILWAHALKGNRVNIEYSEIAGLPQHGLITNNSGNVEIGSLKSIPYWFRLQAQDGCAVSEWTEWFDPLN